jgi:flagellar hook-associated protein 3 FlgL
VESAIQAQQARSVTLEGFLGEITDVDMAEAFTRLEQAQTALQASAFALQSLQKMSLLDLLRGG